MSIPFRVRRAEWVAGVFLLLTVIALVGSLVLLSRARGNFDETARFEVVLAEGYGIAPGSRVEMLGIDVGIIDTLRITDDNRVSASIEIREPFVSRIRQDSRARVKASLDLQGVLGGVGLVISPGTAEFAALQPGDTVEVLEPRSFADLLPQVQGDPLVEDFEALIHNARMMTSEVADPNSPLRQLLEQSGALLAKVQDEKSTIGRVLQDDGEVYDRMLGTLDEVEKSLARLDRVLARSGGLVRRADGMFDDSKAMVDKAGRLMDDSGKVIAQVGPVLDGTDTAMKDLDEAVVAFAETTRALGEVVEALGPLVKNMDEMVRDMDEVAEAAKKVFPIRRHVKRQERRDK
ncbi:MAG: MlaD family protein [Deltaproteobacteria bacterium]|nr:MlaD family protein [Deltaproteobacteria bacterium]